MSEDIGHDETVLGAALGRAIASQPARATPFERSRLALRMAGGGRSVLAPLLAAAAAILLGLTLGATLLGQRGPDTGGGATQPSPTATAPATVSPSAPSPTATPRGPVEKLRVYFARDQLPPVGADLDVELSDGTTAEGRVKARLRALATATAPSGAVNILASLRTKPVVNDVRLSGDLVTVDYTVPGGDWGAAGSAGSLALLQQLVYTASEEPGIRRVLITENGGKRTIIDQIEISEPLTREGTLPYEGVQTEERVALEDDPRAATLATKLDESVPGLTRFAIELKADSEVPEGFWTPRLSAELRPFDVVKGELGEAKWILRVELPGTRTTFDGYRMVGDGTGMQSVERTPIRWIRLLQQGPAAIGVAYELGLDDARPWRVSMEPVTPGTMRLIIDIGGHPQAVSDSIAVYGPKPGDDAARTFTITGTARAFEAHVAWRLKDSREREVANGFVVASLGTSPVWGTFTTEVKVPEGVSGLVTLEVFWPSPRDGADVGTVAIPLRVR